MWLGLFQPLLHNRVWRQVGGRWEYGFGRHNDGLSACTAPERPEFCQKRVARKPEHFYQTCKAVQRVREVYVLEEWTRWTENEAYCAKLI